MLNEWVSSDYLNKRRVLDINKAFKKVKPFPYLVLKNFFKKDKILCVFNEFKSENFIDRNSDLFQFKQTLNDISSTKIKTLSEFYSFFSSEDFGKYILDLTGINIKFGNVDMSGFIYGKTDYLLPHDDRLEGRKIAYVINMSKGFKKSDGGRLQFFNIKNKLPYKIIKSIVPGFNTLVLFEVSDISYHQVEEINSNKERLSFAGWFHG